MTKLRLVAVDAAQVQCDRARGTWRKSSAAKAQKVREGRAQDLEGRQRLINETKDAYRALPELPAPVTHP